MRQQNQDLEKTANDQTQGLVPSRDASVRPCGACGGTGRYNITDAAPVSREEIIAWSESMTGDTSEMVERDGPRFTDEQAAALGERLAEKRSGLPITEVDLGGDA